MASLSIVIPTRRRRELLAASLASLTAARAQLGEPSELIVVSDGDARSPAELVARHDRDARVIDLPEVTGFAGAVAAGIGSATADWLLLLNDDTSLGPLALRELLRVARSRRGVGSATPQIRFADDPTKINSAGLVVDDLGIATDRLLGASIGESEPEPVEVFGCSAAAGLYSRAMLDDIGGFDRSFFAYLEDADVAWRAQMHGWCCLYAPGAVVHHHHSATLGHASAHKYFLVGRNRIRLLAKNADASLLRRRGAAMIAYDLAYVVYVALRERSLAPLRGRLAGIRDWAAYRRAGSSGRRPISLPRSRGLCGALRRRSVWSQAHSLSQPG
jgi:GT2 family glycosyltransferase